VYHPKYTLKGSARQTMPGARTAIAVINGRRVAVMIDQNGRIVRPTVDPATLPDLPRSELIARWRGSDWFPTGELLFADDRVLLKAEDRIVCCDSETGRVLWMGRKSKFPQDAESLERIQLQRQGVSLMQEGGNPPQSHSEVMLFGNRLAQGMVVDRDLVLNLEGELDYAQAAPPARNQHDDLGLAIADDAFRSRTGKNWLAAYDLNTGKLRWYRGPLENPAERGSFLSPPLPLGDRLVAAICDEDRLGIVILDRLTGKTLSTTQLSALPDGGLVAQAPVILSADQARIYVATGAGAVFALDRLTASVLWAVTYPRRLPPGAVQRQQEMMMMMGNGMPAAAQPVNSVEFQENLAIHYGTLVVVLAADFDHLFALDCEDGSLRWEAPLFPSPKGAAPKYCLGVRDGRLFLGSSKVVRRYGMASGKLEWEYPLDAGTGRGLLTAEALLLPRGSEILRIDPGTGAQLGSIRVAHSDGEPVGNLYSTGSRLFAVGPARVAALARDAAAIGKDGSE
jgi:outer membrane protein assembly factor BamB